jgi:DNA topoisomerase-1
VEIIDEGWIRCYRPFISSVTKRLPPIKEGESVKVRRISVEDRFTRPPPRYNSSTILKKMQSEGIGTKATRAGIIQTLYERKFIRENDIEVTELGFEVSDLLAANCPAITSPELTRTLEEGMTMIQQGKAAREEVVKEAIEILKPIIEELKNREQIIGKQLSQALAKAWLEHQVVGDCPTCKTGRLLIIRSKKTGKRFLGCTKYFEGKCQTSFPLPQQGSIRPSGTCGDCGWSRIRILMRGRRPWSLCFNPQCPSKKRLN